MKFENIGINNWSLLISETVYGNTSIHTNIRQRIGILDNLEPEIQMPMSIYRKFYDAMAKQIEFDEVKEDGLLTTSSKCLEIEGKLEPIELLVNDSVLVIKPKGYLKQLKDDRCNI